MTIWLVIWAIVSLSLLAFSGWTLIILFQQKKAWRDFARKHKLRFKNTAFMSSPKINGVYKGYSIGIFTSEHEPDRGTNSRKLTAIEVELESRMPIGGALGSGGMVSIVQSLGYSDEYIPPYEGWSNEYVCRSEDKGVMEAYLNAARVKALVELMKMKNAWVIFICKGNDTLLRIDTPEPFEREDKLTKTIERMIEVARLMELGKGESIELATLKNRRNSGVPVVAIKDEDIAYTGLELEDDDLQSVGVAEEDDSNNAPAPPEPQP